MEQKTSILTVDDNISICKTMSFILKRMGYDVTIANNGYEAISKIKKTHFDTIFMDIKMPGIDGVETYKKIKKIKPDAVVVMMTAYAVNELIKQAMEEGAYGIIYKPLEMRDVFRLLEGILKEKQKVK